MCAQSSKGKVSSLEKHLGQLRAMPEDTVSSNQDSLAPQTRNLTSASKHPIPVLLAVSGPFLCVQPPTPTPNRRLCRVGRAQKFQWLWHFLSGSPQTIAFILWGIFPTNKMRFVPSWQDCYEEEMKCALVMVGAHCGLNGRWNTSSLPSR